MSNNRSSLFEKVQSLFQEKLNISISKDDEGSVTDLNNPPVSFIENLRKIHEIVEILIVLDFFFTQENKDFIRRYLQEIILEGGNPSNWRRGRILIPSVSLKDQLIKSLNELYPNDQGSILHVHTPSIDGLKQGFHGNGAIVKVETNSTYLSPLPDGFMAMRMHEGTMRIHEDTKQIWFRRWIATRIAGYLLSQNQLETFSNKNILHDIAPSEQWTMDAVMAFEGLLKEQQELGWTEGEIPGYVGPDAFYE